MKFLEYENQTGIPVYVTPPLQYGVRKSTDAIEYEILMRMKISAITVCPHFCLRIDLAVKL